MAGVRDVWRKPGIQGAVRQGFPRLPAVFVRVSQVVMGREMIRGDLEGMFIKRHRARRTALSAIAGVSRFGDASLQPEFDVTRKFGQRRVKLLTILGDLVLILRPVLRRQLTLSDRDVPAFVSANRCDAASSSANGSVCGCCARASRRRAPA